MELYRWSLANKKIAMSKKKIVEVISALLIILFLYAGLSKLFQQSIFHQQLMKSPYTNSMAGFLSWLMPLAEILIAGLLLFFKTRLIGLYLSLSIMIMFSLYIYFILNFSYYIPCSCGGVLQNMSWSQHLVFNVFFCLISFAGLLMQIEITDRGDRIKFLSKV